MKKTYLVRRNALLSGANLSWGAWALLFTLFMLLLRLFVPNFFWHISAPAFSAASALAAQSHAFINGFASAAKLAEENERLTDENTALANENQALMQKIAGLEVLQQTSSGIVAGVVARPPQSPYDTFTLAGGARAGITVGQEAFGPGGVPLGVVTSVLTDFSRVTLFSSPGRATEGWVGRANVPLTIFGAGAGAMQASLSRSAGVMEGDTIFAPGPGQLPIGRVARIDSNPSSPSVTLLIMPILNLFTIAWVELRDTGITAFSFATSTLP